MPHDLGSPERQSPELPVEILSAILERLPVKPLIRFQSVCKLWRTIIESPEFSRQHIDYSNKSSKPSGDSEKIFLQLRSRTPDPTDLHGFHSYYSVVASPYDGSLIRYRRQPLEKFPKFDRYSVCSDGGLLLLHYELGESMFLLNPTTNKFREFPSPPQSITDESYATGFGFDSSIQDYKIVRIVGVGSRALSGLQAQIFTFRTPSWRSIEGFPDPNYTLPSNQTTAFIHGAVHFLARSTSGSGTRDRYAILGVNLATEEFVNQILPPALVDRGSALNVLAGRLSLQCTVLPRFIIDYKFEVWSMMEYGNSESWTKILSVPYPGSGVPITVMQNGDLLVRKDEDVFICNQRNVDWKLKIPGEIAHCSLSLGGVHTYTESMATPYIADCF